MTFFHVAFVLHVVQFFKMAPFLECQSISNINVFFFCMLLVPLCLFDLEGLWVPIELVPTLAVAKTRERRQRWERNRTFLDA